MKNNEAEFGGTAAGQNGPAYAGRKKLTPERRTFAPDFKIAAVKMVTEEGASLSEAARLANVSVGVLARWVQKWGTISEETFGHGGPTKSAPQEVELLRTEVQRLRAQSDVLIGLVGYFARTQGDVGAEALERERGGSRRSRTEFSRATGS